MNRFALYLAILALVNLYALALVEWKLSSRHHVGLSGHRYPRSLLMQSSPRDTYHRGNYTKMLLAASAKQGKPSDQAIPRSIAWRTVERLKSSRRINDWMQHLATNGKFSDPPIFGTWGIQDQIEFIKLLQDKGAYKAIMLFLDNSGRQHVKVCTTAVFAMTLSPNDRSKAIDILNKMDQQGVEPTSLTFIALLGSVDGPAATFQMIKRIETYTKVKWNAEIFNSAIYACRRSPRGSGPNDKDWQAALNLFQQMRRKHINPTIKTYHAVLQVLSRTGKVQMAKSILQQLKNTPNLKADDRVWAAAINVCAQAGDYEGAIEFMNEMQEDGCRPNLLHCSALLKAFAQTGQDQMALMALTMMLGEDGSTDTSIGAEPGFRLPPTTPDVVALNTVLTVCSKAGNFEGAMLILKRIKAGDFRDPKSQEVISPDRITYHSLLVACRDPKAAKDIVKEVRKDKCMSHGKTDACR
jgi:pentatricopeptide repeat protein